MHLYLDKDRPFYSLKANRKSSKPSPLCLACNALKRELKSLKELHQRLTKEIKIITAYIPKEIEKILSKIVPTASPRQKEKSYASLKPSSSTRKMSSDRPGPSQLKQPYQSKLKVEDGIIKQSIKMELKVIKALELKQKDLRMLNEKHESLRKSLSKESLSSVKAPKMRKLQSTPRLNEKSSQSSFVDHAVMRRELPDQSEWISSPKFGMNTDDVKFQVKLRYSSYDSKSNKKQEATIENEQLKCPNGHECYKGETLNHLPHGYGTLVNCCSKIPFKVNPKTLKYTGCFKNGQFQGKGSLVCKDNVRFEGSFSKGMRHGQGTIYLQGASERGIWDQDKLVSFV